MDLKGLIKKVRKAVRNKKNAAKNISEEDNRTILAGKNAILERKAYTAGLTHP